MQNDELLIPVTNYDLAATLTSGQAFRWEHREGGWEGVIGKYWVRLRQVPEGVLAETVVPATDRRWLIDYLQAGVEIEKVLATFPSDPAMQASAAHCQGLRLLRQEPWECLASFILSSTKQIVQIQQIVALLCQRFGDPLTIPSGHAPVFSFPSADRLAQATEAQLRGCKMGFRAPNLLRTARMIAQGEVNLERIRKLDLAEARAELERLPGVGSKIANCVLLFAYGFQGAFPVDVWVMKALRQLYFPRRRPNKTRLLKFTATYFGPNAGYAQQYLFHYMRTREKIGISVLNRRVKKREIASRDDSDA
jgi:N-glycosylase/DNA lyase